MSISFIDSINNSLGERKKGNIRLYIRATCLLDKGPGKIRDQVMDCRSDIHYYYMRTEQVVGISCSLSARFVMLLISACVYIINLRVYSVHVYQKHIEHFFLHWISLCSPALPALRSLLRCFLLFRYGFLMAGPFVRSFIVHFARLRIRVVTLRKGNCLALPGNRFVIVLSVSLYSIVSAVNSLSNVRWFTPYTTVIIFRFMSHSRRPWKWEKKRHAQW